MYFKVKNSDMSCLKIYFTHRHVGTVLDHSNTKIKIMFSQIFIITLLFNQLIRLFITIKLNRLFPTRIKLFISNRS